jgi:hypothetical protein
MIKHTVINEHIRVVATAAIYWLMVFFTLRLIYANSISILSISISSLSSELVLFWMKGHIFGAFSMCMIMHAIVKKLGILNAEIVQVVVTFTFFVVVSIVSIDIIKDNILVDIAVYFNIAGSDLLLKWHDPLLNTWFGFNFFGGWVGLYILNDYFFKYKKSVTEEAKLISKLKDENFCSKVARINPNFIMSELAVTKLTIKNNEKQNARVRVCQLADVIRYSLMPEKINLVTFKKELDVILDYLALTNKSNLLIMPKDIFNLQDMDKYLIPPMVIKEFLDIAYENNIMDSLSISISHHNQLEIILTSLNPGKSAMIAYNEYMRFLDDRLEPHENISIKKISYSLDFKLIFNVSINKNIKKDTLFERKTFSNITGDFEVANS